MMPAKPRSPTYGRSPATNALRSMPGEKPLPAPVRTPDAQLVVGVELVEGGVEDLKRGRVSLDQHVGYRDFVLQVGPHSLVTTQ